jgi:flagellar M-ring protein FliF
MSAVAELPATSLEAPNWLQRLAALDRGQKIKLALGIALLVLVSIGGAMMTRQSDWRVLYANLGDKDGGAVIAQLAQMNVPYKYSEGGGAILVPSDRVHDLRLRLAAQGLPKGSVSGFEAMEGSRFGVTQFQERLNFQRGLEGELTRSIQAVAAVQSARVHLALPNQNGFFREQQKPTASVLLSLYPGRILDRAQLAGIVHLVASSVPEMTPESVSVVDDNGKLLSATPDAAGVGGDVQQLQYVQQLEQLYSKRIVDILEPVVGRQNVKAQVTAEIDFSQTESTSELHKPNQTPDAAAVRSQQVVETGGGNQAIAPTGVPGATSNQPSAPASAPVNGSPGALTAAGGGSASTPAKKESVTNYEVDKTVKVVRGSAGSIKRLSAAVVVNYQPGPDEKGKPGPAKAMTAEQVEQMTALVRDTIGYNKDRGDSVNLMNTPFMGTVTESAAVPLWKQPEVLELAKSFAWPVGMLLFGMLVLFGMVRPAVKSINAPAPAATDVAPSAGAQLDAIEGETPERPDLLPAPVANELLPPTPEQLRLDDARQLAKQNPIAVANIIKTWVNGEAPT